jgi:hypothetical protein
MANPASVRLNFPLHCATNRRLNSRRDARPGNGPNFKKRDTVQDLERNYKIWKGVYTIRRHKPPVFTTVGDPFPSVQFAAGVRIWRDCGAGVSPAPGRRDACTTNYDTTSSPRSLHDNPKRR